MWHSITQKERDEELPWVESWLEACEIALTGLSKWIK